MCFALLVILTPANASSEEVLPKLHVRHSYNVSSDQVYARRTEYFVALLQLALKKSGREFSTEKIEINTITESRNTRNVLSGLYDVNWMNTNREREAILQAVRIPLFKGLIGWRLMLTHRDNQNFVKDFDSLENLKFQVIGQGHDWPDTQVLRYHNFSVVLSASRDSLVQMLVRKRIDYFPRSIFEIWDEYEFFSNMTYADSDDFPIEIENSIALSYPAACYFFVKKDNHVLAEALSDGLKAAINDGSFDTLFYAHFGEAIRKANLDKRKVFYLTNPTMSDETPLDKKELWFTVDDLKDLN